MTRKKHTLGTFSLWVLLWLLHRITMSTPRYFKTKMVFIKLFTKGFS